MIFLISFGVQGDNLSDDDSYNMVWIVIDRLSLDQLFLANTPNIDKLQKKGAFGLMNVRTVDHLHSESTYLNVNTGNRCQGSEMSHNGINFGKGALNDKIQDLITLNNKTNYKAKPGLLGDLARENNITIGVLGNSDIVGKNFRTIVSMAMDSNGFVPYAQIGKNILQKTEKPWGYQSDYNKLAAKFTDFKGFVDALFIETGDISRIDNFLESEESKSVLSDDSKISDNSYTVSPKDISNNEFSENSLLSDKKSYNNYKDYINYQEEKIDALGRIDAFIGFIMNNIDLNKTQLAIVVPTPTEEDIQQGKRLSWVLFAGQGINHGWLKSDSTRRRGIITIADLMTGFLTANLESDLSKKVQKSKVNLEGFAGRTFNSVYDQRASWNNLRQLNKKISFIYNIRSPFIKIFIFFQMIVIIMAISKIVWKKIRQIYIFSRTFEYLLIALLLVPINYMLLSSINIFSIIDNVILLFVILVIEEFLLLKFINKPIYQIFVISWVMVLLISFNLIYQYRMLADSILGYSSIIGARYYGLGNEYMGFYLGAFILALTVSLELARNRSFQINPIIIILSFLIITYFIGAVNLGANFGGMVTALIAGGISCYYIYKDKEWMNRWVISGLGLLFLIVMILLDYSGMMGDSSHIGQGFQKIIEGQWQWILDTVLRKFTMNLKLLRWTIWSRVLLVMIVYLFVLLRKPVPRLKSFFENNLFFKAGLYGVLSGSVVTMFVNDSGVVAAATILFYPVMSLLYFLK